MTDEIGREQDKEAYGSEYQTFAYNSYEENQAYDWLLQCSWRCEGTTLDPIADNNTQVYLVSYALNWIVVKKVAMSWRVTFAGYPK